MLRLPTFTFLRPKSLAQALRMKEEAGPNGKYVAGGTDLYPNMKRRHQEPKVVISLTEIRGLRRRPTVRWSDGPTDRAIRGEPDDAWLVVGAGVTLTELQSDRRVRARNMGTFGGNLCLDTRCTYYNQSYEWRKSIDFCMKKDGATCWVAPSSPRCWAVNSSDTAPVVVALGAELVLAGPTGERAVPAAQFFRNDGIDYLTKSPHEILTEVRLPPADGWDGTYWKLRRRGSFDFPVLGVAACVRWDGDRVADARIVLGAVASYPMVVDDAARAIVGSALEDAAVTAAADAAFRPSKPMDNTDFHLAWRKEMTRNYVRGALEELRGRRFRTE
jgi:4-hydroxybenzoyl-CoA reductase subunit beta